MRRFFLTLILFSSIALGAWSQNKKELAAAVTSLQENVDTLQKECHELQRFVLKMQSTLLQYEQMQAGMKGQIEKLEKKVDSLRTASDPLAPTGTHNGHAWVDLGLPSGTKWATMNVGASSPSDYGNYYAWGETSPKSSYDWSNLKYCLDSEGKKFSKYVTDSNFGNVDGKKELNLCDDAAYVNWGSGWRMPSLDQIMELSVNCTWIWTSMGGHNGYKVVGPNGNSLFLPAAGDRDGSSSDYVGSRGYYWSRTLYSYSSYGDCAYVLYFFSFSSFWNYYFGRYYGQSVRPVLGS